MAAPTALRDTTDLLVTLLRLQLAGDDDDRLNESQIQPIPPTAVDDDSTVRLTLSLYDVSKAGSLNTGSKRITDNRTEKPPLGLELRYLLMAFPSADDERDAVLAQQQLLGAAMQTLYDAEAIEPEELPAGLDERLTITLEQHEPSAATELWSSMPDLPLYPHVIYTVRPVRIPSTQSTPFERVSERDVRVGRGVTTDTDGESNTSDEHGDRTEMDRSE
ncbi:DUF4255 domain-containing protein [Natrialba sp. SSL1]|uniref:DUF4255 domain-containing protein n=1 Tax=Natrialba sp. SSL1 TaxID=1869245 RepID=UPI0008F85407|nr:DUF4255 domain-containing protein [Natrialba sp. SSL1]OIB58817.1 hypothetical protein BBD46_01780 [Natrialba sp. SSL1]